MKCLRSSPLRLLADASWLHVFIFACCDSFFSDRHVFMKAWRSVPFRLFAPASALQSFMRSCCAVRHRPGAGASSAAPRMAAVRSLVRAFMRSSLLRSGAARGPSTGRPTSTGRRPDALPHLSRRRPAALARPLAHRHFTTLPPLKETQLGVPGKTTGNRASMHCPLAANGGWSTSVPISGKCAGSTGKVPFFPLTWNLYLPGGNESLKTLTIWIPSTCDTVGPTFLYAHVVALPFIFQPALVPGS